MVFTETMSVRKTIMTERSDAFLALPGGLGTLDEIFEELTMRQLGRHDKPVAFLDCGGYWDSAMRMIDEAVEKGFAAPSVRDLFGRFTEAEECLAWLEREAAR